MLVLHCIHCGQRSEGVRMPLDEGKRATLESFRVRHDDVCGPKAVGGMFEADDPEEGGARRPGDEDRQPVEGGNGTRPAGDQDLETGRASRRPLGSGSTQVGRNPMITQ